MDLTRIDGNGCAPRTMYADLLTNFGGMLGAQLAAGTLQSIPQTAPDTILAMRERTLGVADTFFNIPIGGGRNITVAAMPRFNLTDLNLIAQSNERVRANNRGIPFPNAAAQAQSAVAPSNDRFLRQRPSVVSQEAPQQDDQPQPLDPEPIRETEI